MKTKTKLLTNQMAKSRQAIKRTENNQEDSNSEDLTMTETNQET